MGTQRSSTRDIGRRLDTGVLLKKKNLERKTSWSKRPTGFEGRSSKCRDEGKKRKTRELRQFGTRMYSTDVRSQIAESIFRSDRYSRTYVQAAAADEQTRIDIKTFKQRPCGCVHDETRSVIFVL